MWKDLSHYFERFKNLKPPKEFKITTIQKVVHEVTGIIIETNKIHLRGGIVFLSVPPLYKSEIFLNQEKIIDALKKDGVSIIKIT